MDSKEYLKSNTIKNRHFIVHQNNGISFNDNTTRSTLQKKRIEVIRSSANCSTIQMFLHRKINDYFMDESLFQYHKQKANNYFLAAIRHIDSLKKTPGRRVVAHHNGVNKVREAGDNHLPHAEIQILNHFGNKGNLEMGITRPMCHAGEYRSSPAGCIATVQSGYEINKTIFVRDPSGFYMFPYHNSPPIGEQDTSLENLCGWCNSPITSSSNFCDECYRDLEKMDITI